MAIVNGVSDSGGNTLGDILYAIISGVQNASPEELNGMRLDSQLSSSERDAYEALKTIFGGYGLSSLAPKILEYVQQGYGSDTITMLLQRTPEYKQRFSANEIRKKNGMPVLDPREYLATETAYRQLMRNAGLPEGFYDTPDDFTKFLSSDVSPTELKGRVDLAIQATEYADPELRQALRAQGVDTGGMTAYFLDPNRAMPLIQKQMQASQIGAAALRQNLQMDATTSMELAKQGITTEQARQGYGQISGFLSDTQKLATIYGDHYDQKVAEAEVFGQSGQAGEKRKTLASKERANFGGAVGAAKGGLGGTGGQH
jgi:hypothetical protein